MPGAGFGGGAALSAGQLDLGATLGTWLPVLHVQSAADLEENWTWTTGEIWREVDDALTLLHSQARIKVVSLSASQSSPLFALPARVVTVLHVAVDGATMKPSAVAEVEALAGGGWRVETGTPKRWLAENDGAATMRIWPSPTGAGSIQVLAVVMLDEVTGAAIQAPGWMGDAGMFGAMAKLLAREGDAAMPEVAAQCAVHADMYRQVAVGLYGVGM